MNVIGTRATKNSSNDASLASLRSFALQVPYGRTRTRSFSRACALASLFVACGTAPEAMDAPRQEVPHGTVILVSADGFRWDYVDRGITPNAQRLMDSGVRGDLVPSFPTKTFPNHYTLVTGLYPDHHGIVANSFWDPRRRERFSMYDRAKVQDGSWWGGEPVWVTAERNGRATAPLFWPGSEAAIDGVRPSHWLPYDGRMSNSARVDWILGLLDLGGPERPVFLTLYFSDTDDLGHAFDPDTDAVNEAIVAVDDAIGRLIDGIEARGLWSTVNVIFVADHGMTPIRNDQVIFLDDYIDLSRAEIADWNPVVAIWPHDGEEESIYAALASVHPRMHVYLRADLPARLHYGTSARVAPITGIADAGWSITSHAYHEAERARFAGGNHGYDPEVEDMRGVLIARGPALREGVRIGTIENIHVYRLVMEVLGLPPVPSDGSLLALEEMLAR